MHSVRGQRADNDYTVMEDLTSLAELRRSSTTDERQRVDNVYTLTPSYVPVNTISYDCVTSILKLWVCNIIVCLQPVPYRPARSNVADVSAVDSEVPSARGDILTLCSYFITRDRRQ